MNNTELKRYLKVLYKNLNTLREREAKFGSNPPVELLNQIEDHQTAIKLVEARLAGDLTNEQLIEQLAPLNVTLDRGGAEIITGTKIQIGSLVIPAVPLLAGLLLFIGLVTFLAWLYFVPAQMPLNTFNVAVAEFGQVNAAGQISPSEDGRNLSEWMFGELQAEYKDWPAGRPVIWHDSMGLAQKRTPIGLITGQTPAERNRMAREVVEQVGANMLIYGNIETGNQPVQFTPEFYIAEIRNEADELVGSHQLGAPIEVRLPINLYDERTSTFFEGKLGSRIDALIWFTRGLALDLSGRHEDALALFKQAEPALAGWKNDQGKEILYYFIGREALFLGRSDPQSQDTTAYLAEAETAFQQALTINPAYVRAHIGLGGVHFQRAQRLPPAERLQTEDLSQAIAQYQRALAQDNGEADLQVKLKGYLGLGVAYRLEGEAYLHAGDLTQADASFDQAISQLNEAMALLSQDQHRLQAQAYLALGSAYEQKAHIRYVQQNTSASKSLFQEAIAAYEQCSQHADQEFYDSLLQDLKRQFCDPYRQDVQKVLDRL